MWLKLEGRGAFHAKVIAAGNEAYGAWTRAGQWAAESLTNGFVPLEVARTIALPKVWKRLVEAKAGHDVGLVEARDGGYQIHDFLIYNPPGEEEKSRREELSAKRAAAGLSGATVRWQKDSKRHSKPDGKTVASAMANGWQSDGSVSDPGSDPGFNPPNPPPSGGDLPGGGRIQSGSGEGGNKPVQRGPLPPGAAAPPEFLQRAGLANHPTPEAT